ncbi:hypothetical protein C8Q74DRAFT_104399 [Fomes fomentarius]|nr:hypothetical protein C8Q74DRAFT_104399 [Fomes fomentarius]
MSDAPMLPHGERRALLLNDFPVELLRQIFSWMSPARQLNPSQPRVAPAWLVCTGICRYWRDVVQGDPTFWTQIDLGRTEWLALCLERSAHIDGRDTHPGPRPQSPANETHHRSTHGPYQVLPQAVGTLRAVIHL